MRGAAIDEVAAAGWTDGVDHRRGRRARASTCTARRPRCSRCSTAARRSPHRAAVPPRRRRGRDRDRPPRRRRRRRRDVAPRRSSTTSRRMANVPGILAEGPDWFRSVGTAESPGTIVCTVTRRTCTARRRRGRRWARRCATVIDDVGGGARARAAARRRHVRASPTRCSRLGVRHPAQLRGDAAAGSGLGAAGFIVFDDTDRPRRRGRRRVPLPRRRVVRPVHAVQAGRAGDRRAPRPPRPATSPTTDDADRAPRRLGTVTDGARCYLAAQHQRRRHEHPRAWRRSSSPPTTTGRIDPVEPALIAPIVDLAEGVADARRAPGRTKQPDWTFDELDSGKSPADLIDQGERDE